MASGMNVFISYASDTRLRAEELTRELERHGIRAWVDFKDLQPGQRWREALEHAIGEANWVLILIGVDSRATQRQEAEWSAALSQTWADSQKRLLPIVFGHDDPPPFLRNWVALRIDPDTESSTWTGKVLDTIRNSRKEGESLAPDHRQERKQRLEEIRRTAEGMREGHGDLPATAPDPVR